MPGMPGVDPDGLRCPAGPGPGGNAPGAGDRCGPGQAARAPLDGSRGRRRGRPGLLGDLTGCSRGVDEPDCRQPA
nr:hypothetical protein CYJ24_02200 [Actinomyces naeslundii]